MKIACTFIIKYICLMLLKANVFFSMFFISNCDPEIENIYLHIEMKTFTWGKQNFHLQFGKVRPIISQENKINI